MIGKLQNPVFQRISAVASRDNTKVYLIGGYVRDILMNRPTKDIDIVVVGSGIQIAKKVAEDLGKARVQVFKSFGTAMVQHKEIQIEVPFEIVAE